jgi:hypothetical protein
MPLKGEFLVTKFVLDFRAIPSQEVRPYILIGCWAARLGRSVAWDSGKTR